MGRLILGADWFKTAKRGVQQTTHRQTRRVEFYKLRGVRDRPRWRQRLLRLDQPPEWVVRPLPTASATCATTAGISGWRPTRRNRLVRFYVDRGCSRRRPRRRRGSPLGGHGCAFQLGGMRPPTMRWFGGWPHRTTQIGRGVRDRRRPVALRPGPLSVLLADPAHPQGRCPRRRGARRPPTAQRRAVRGRRLPDPPLRSTTSAGSRWRTRARPASAPLSFGVGTPRRQGRTERDGRATT